MPAHGGWKVALLVAGAVLYVQRCSTEATVTAPSGCTFSPRAETPLGMVCDYGNSRYSMQRLSGEQLPASIQAIQIMNGQEIVIGEGTFSGLPNLQRLHFSDIGWLRFHRNNWSTVAQPGLVTITMQRIRRVSLYKSAFLGWSAPGPMIIISDIHRCFIGTRAFEYYDTVIQSVLLQNVGTLVPGPGAFGARIHELRISNVSELIRCSFGSFDGPTNSVLLDSVHFTHVGSGCLRAKNNGGWASLKIRSSYLGNVHRFGIKGTCDEVVIEDSHIGRVDSRGIHIKASTFTIRSTKVEELAPYSLNVTLDRSASLQTLSVGFLRANALELLNAGAGGVVALEDIAVTDVEHNSLLFSDETHTRLKNITIASSCHCNNIITRTRHFPEVGRTQQLAKQIQQNILWRQIAFNVRCTAGTTTPILAEFYSQKCCVENYTLVPALDTCSLLDPLTTQPPPVTWIWPASTGIPAVMLLILLTLGAAAAAKHWQVSRQESGTDDHLRTNDRSRASGTGAEYVNFTWDNASENSHTTQSREDDTSATSETSSRESSPSIVETEYVEMHFLPRPPSTVYFATKLGLLHHSSHLPRPSSSMFYEIKPRIAPRRKPRPV
ncbi:uncharacterized protein LOC122371728 [Amphibalanus amphitrite]|uniref:uncharacterized protein LOC122371728 n=1 Tax=Amphibalanus amphitrite TaxID=1232801 RepID=UPI001C9050F4|nr:uncharacterized protein LOC122371728 [Amphibalanus amphitrite]